MFDNPESPHKTFFQTTQDVKQSSTYHHEMKSLTDVQISHFNVNLPNTKMLQQSKVEHDKKTEQESLQSNPNKLSITQSELQTRALVKFIMERNKKKVIHHKIGKINKFTQLYAKPQNHSIKNEFIQNQAKVKNQKLRSIHKRFISQPSNISEVNTQSSDKSQTRKKMIAVSGLVSYKFNSIRAARNLGLDFQSDEQKLSQKLLNIKQKAKCSTIRSQKIKNKSFSTNKQAKTQQKSFNSSFSNNLSGDKMYATTNKFLCEIQKSKKQSSYIYGDEYRKIASINQIMKSQKASRQLAQFQIQEIIRVNAKPPTIKLKRKARVIDEEKELQNRRKQVKRHRVMLNNLTFVNDS